MGNDIALCPVARGQQDSFSNMPALQQTMKSVDDLCLVEEELFARFYRCGLMVKTYHMNLQNPSPQSQAYLFGTLWTRAFRISLPDRGKDSSCSIGLSEKIGTRSNRVWFPEVEGSDP